MSMRVQVLPIVVLTISLVVGADRPVQAAARTVEAGWPQAHSDVAADPAVHFGRLSNGMRYAIQTNATPPGQVSLRLRFGSGSLQETELQQGLAHFLEHMAFRGSRTVPDGEVWKRLERLGLKMGADTNAFTAQTQTVYKFDLAHNDAASIDTGLTMLRETGDGLALDATTFDAERGVVLSELRLNDNPSRHMVEAMQRFMLPGQRASARQPIGKQDVLEHAPVALARGYYETWYRPERATLIVTGDVDPAMIEAQIRAHFSDWQNSGAAAVDPELGTPQAIAPAASVFAEPGAPSMSVLAWVAPYDGSPDSVAHERLLLNRQIGLAILNRRLETAAAAADRQFTQAQVAQQPQAHSALMTTLFMLNEPGAWRPALLAADQLRRQVLDGGVQQGELEREIAVLRAQFRAEVDAASTRHTPQLADALLSTLDSGEVYTSPAQDLHLSERLFRGISRTTVDEALRGLFAGRGPLAFVSSPVAVEGGDAAVLAALRDAQGAKVATATVATAVAWPYAGFGAAGVVAERSFLTDLGVTEVRYANGVRLNVKPTAFSADQVVVNVSIDGGRRLMDPTRPSVVWASGAVVQGGTVQLDYPTIERVLAGKNVRVTFQIGDGALAFSGETTKADLATQMQLLTAYVVEPGFRPEAFEQQRSALLPQLEQMNAVPMSLFQAQLGGLLHAGDRRWAFPDRAQVLAARPDDLRALIAPALSTGAIEVTVVGDVTVERATEVVGATFGALAPRAAASALPGSTRFPAPTGEPVLLRHAGAAEQGVAAIAWPTTDAFTGLPLSAARQLLADIMQQRLFQAVRVQAGTSYSAQAMSQASATFPDYGILLAFADIPPAKTAVFYDAVATIAADLKTHGPTPDELDRSRNPALAKATQARQTNGYWLTLLSQVQADPRYAELLRHGLADLEVVGAADVQRAAQTYLLDERAWKLLVQPPPAK